MTTNQKYKAIKKKLGITDREVGSLFGMGKGKTSPEVQLSNSSARDKYVSAFVGIFELIGERHVDFFDLEKPVK